MRALLRRVLPLAACCTVAGACTPDGSGSTTDFATEDRKNGAFLGPDGVATELGVAEATAEALGVLKAVNDAGAAQLVDAVGLSPRTAESIVAARAGDDGELATRDDREITSLASLDAIPYVGAIAFGKLYGYADERGYIDWQMTWRDEAPRIIAIGDVHGDISAAQTALQIAEVVDGGDQWSGGSTVVVQLGDVLDRGDDERALVDWFADLRAQASAAGGAFVMLIGNHEVMNVDGDFRYVTPGAFDGFSDLADPDPDDERLAEFSPEEQGRAAAFLSGGPLARRLAEHSVAVLVGETLFVHAGVVPRYAEYGLERINFESRAWMLWDDLSLPAALDADDGPVWYRDYGDDAAVDCELLAEALMTVGAVQMVIGHTVQEGGVTSACDGQLWRVDVGLSSYYEGPVEVLEIQGDEMWTIRAE